jgi:2-polyprenyl-6-methoxyphenol hydroxylase-like FAD-dependent oxidoreductase
MITPPVLIVGAGPTGLALALWLTRLGVAVRIIDKTAEPGTTSRALAVQVRTLELYRQFGIANSVVAGGVKITGVNFWVKGAKAARVPLARIGEGLTPYPFVLIFPQDAHERLLIDQLGAFGVRVERGKELISFDQQGEKVRATLKSASGAEELFEAAYLAAAMARHRPSGSNSPSAFLAELMRDSSTSRTWRGPGRLPTGSCTSISRMPTLCSSFP